MGIWDFISSGAETVKRNTPDLATPVTKVCARSYYYSAATVRKIDDVVRVNGLQKLGQYIYMPDEEGRAKIINFSTKFVKNASFYAVKEAVNIIPALFQRLMLVILSPPMYFGVQTFSPATTAFLVMVLLLDQRKLLQCASISFTTFEGSMNSCAQYA